MRLVAVFVFVVFATLLSCSSVVRGQVTKVTLGQLWQFNESREAGLIAIDDLRAGKFPGVLSGIDITLMEAQDLGRSTVIVQTLPMTGYCDGQKEVLGIAGGSFSSTSTQLQGLLSPLQIPQISPSATSTELSDESAYPYFFRTAPPDSQQASAIVALMHGYGWARCSIVSSADTYGREGLKEFLTAAAAENIEVVQSLTVQVNQEDYSVEIRALKKATTAINVWFAPDPDATNAFVLQASDAGLFSSKYVWIFSDAYTSNIAKPDGPGDSKLQKTLHGSLGVISAGGIGPVYDDFQRTWNSRASSKDFSIGIYTVTAYDAMIALAHGVDAVIKAGQNPANGSLLREALFKVNFTGATGRVQFDEVGDRIGFFDVYGAQYDSLSSKYSTVRLGTVSGNSNSSFSPPLNFTFASGSVTWPTDTLPRKSHIAKWGWALIALGIAGGVILIALAVYFIIKTKFHLILVPKAANVNDEWK